MMIWLVIINREDKIDLAQTFSYEADEFNYLPTEDNKPIMFNTHEDAIRWISMNIEPHLISTKSEKVRAVALRSKFLKKK